MGGFHQRAGHYHERPDKGGHVRMKIVVCVIGVRGMCAGEMKGRGELEERMG